MVGVGGAMAGVGPVAGGAHRIPDRWVANEAGGRYLPYFGSKLGMAQRCHVIRATSWAVGHGVTTFRQTWQMTKDSAPKRYVFPRWTNYLLPILVLAGVGGGVYVPLLMQFGLSAETLNVGYAPEQPVPFSHALHAGELGMDCRYCHSTVEDASFAAIPPTQTCLHCHSPGDGVGIFKQSPSLAWVRESQATGASIPWRKVHDMPDHVFFDHAAHVNKGVSCVSCHGRVDTMEVVHQVESMSMAWCLDCHRAPEEHLRPQEHVMDMTWDPRSHELAESGDTREEAQLRVGRFLVEKYNIHDEAFMTSCSTCHR